jgi:hypothetical protein
VIDDAARSRPEAMRATTSAVGVSRANEEVEDFRGTEYLLSDLASARQLGRISPK